MAQVVVSKDNEGNFFDRMPEAVDKAYFLGELPRNPVSIKVSSSSAINIILTPLAVI